MTNHFHRWLVIAALTAFAVLGATRLCQADDLPSAEAPAVAGAGQLPVPAQVQDRPAAYILPPPPPDYPCVSEDNGGNPLLDRPEAASPGIFFNVESSVVAVHLRNQLIGGSAPNFNVGFPATGGLPITGDLVAFRGNTLDPTVTPRFELGYRFPDGFGELRLSYRFMDTSGSDTLQSSDFLTGDKLGPASQHGRLDLNVIDLDLGTRQFSLGPDFSMRTAVGLRYATTFFDSQVAFLDPVTLTGTPFGTAPFTRLSQTEASSNRYFGAHGVLELDRNLCWLPGLSLFGRLEGCGLYGRVHQTFTETFVQTPGFTAIRVTNGVGSPTLATQIGFSYDVPQWNHARFMIGYQYEMWWQFARGDNDLSFGTLDDQGLFLRAEFNW